MSEIEKAEKAPARRRYRNAIPKQHKASIDTRVQWLWHQKFGTVQMIYSNTDDMLDLTAATLILQAIMMKDLDSIKIVFDRLEGGSVADTILADEDLII